MRSNSTPPSVLIELQRCPNAVSQIAYLRDIKNQLVGHEIRKVEWIGYGIVPILSNILRSSKSGNKQVNCSTDGKSKNTGRWQDDYDQDELIVHVTDIVGIIAQGNASFVRPLLDSPILPQLLEILSNTPSHPKLSLAVLRCLNIIADNWPYATSNQWISDKRLVDLLYLPQFIDCWTKSIRDTSVTVLSQHISTSALSLLCKTCTNEKQKKALVENGVFNALIYKLASFVVAQGLVVPQIHMSGHKTSSQNRPLPPPAPSMAPLPEILQAIALLVDQSRKRTKLFLTSEAILAVFPIMQDEDSFVNSQKRSWNAQISNTSSSGTNAQNPIDRLLPYVPGIVNQIPVEHLNFPPLGSGSSGARRRPSNIQSTELTTGSQPESTENAENPVVSWLVYLVRSEMDLCRLMAAKLLINLSRLGFTSKSRLPLFCKVLVPMLVRMLDQDYSLDQRQDMKIKSMTSIRLLIKEQVPAILADLVMDDHSLQKAAVDARAIKTLSAELKITFESFPDQTPPPWTAEKSAKAEEELTEIARNRSDRVRTIRHRMIYRENLLKALAALAPFNDEYRKAICDQGVLPCIIDSLKPTHISSEPSNDEMKDSNELEGNPTGTLLAACGVIRALTRSVSALRTNLIDAGVAAPVLKLLTNPDPEIRVAATKVIGNLALDFSPMKEAIGNQHVIKTLCEHAHSAHPRLRFESLWALKQLVVNSTNTLKMSLIQELGPSWMKQLISTDPADIPPGIVIGLTDMNFHPLQSNQSSSRMNQRTDDVLMNGSDVTESHGSNMEDDEDVNRHTLEDDRAIQEQLLDLIRNLFCGEKASEIIEYVLTEMGQREFFDILLARIRPRVIPGATRKDNKSMPPPVGVVIKVLYIIIHISASLSKFRNTVASNAPLMRQVLTYSHHPQSMIRAQCAWIAINLTYEDDPADQAACKHRASDLQRVGYSTKLSALEDDTDLDVRERTKTAIHLIQRLLS